MCFVAYKSHTIQNLLFTLLVINLQPTHDACELMIVPIEYDSSANMNKTPTRQEKRETCAYVSLSSHS